MRDIRTAVVCTDSESGDDLADDLAERSGLRVVLRLTGRSGTSVRPADLRRAKCDVAVVLMAESDVTDPVLRMVVGASAKVVLAAERMGDDQVYAAARIGVRGFASSGDVDEVALAVVETHRDGSWLPPRLGGGLVRFLSRSPTPDPMLTAIERDILEQVCDGALNSEIARTLCCTSDNIKWHLKNTYRKLQVRNRAEAAAYAVRTGIVGA